MKSPSNSFTQNAISCNACSLRHLCIPNGLSASELDELEKSIDKTLNIHSCDAIALEDSLLCKLPMDVFENLCDKLPGLRRVMMQQIGKEISHSQHLLLSLGQLPTEERLASYLLQLAEHFHSRGFSKSEFILPMSRQDLSNYLGMAVETLSRIISRMGNDKLIKIEQRKVIITDLNKLEILAHASCS